jgi:hypothetical protein
MMMLLGVAAGVTATLTFRDVRSKADVVSPTPSPLVDIAVPSPTTELDAPYIRLVTAKKQYGLTSQVPVDVYLNTNGVSVMEADIVVTFDPQVLELTKDKITSTDIFKVISVVPPEEGTTTVSLFINPQLGHEPVVLTHEQKIATLLFKTKSVPVAEAHVALTFGRGDLEKTSLVEYSKEVRNSKNILKAVEGAVFAITP